MTTNTPFEIPVTRKTKKPIEEIIDLTGDREEIVDTIVDLIVE